MTTTLTYTNEHMGGGTWVEIAQLPDGKVIVRSLFDDYQTLIYPSLEAWDSLDIDYSELLEPPAKPLSWALVNGVYKLILDNGNTYLLPSLSA